MASRQQRLQDLGRQRGIGEHEGEQGRHVGLDHARALGDAGEVTWVPAMVACEKLPLAKVSVVRIASAASRQAPGLKPACSCGSAATISGDRQGLADDAGRGDIDLLGRAADQSRYRLRLRPHRGIARRPDQDVRAAGIDDQAARPAARQDAPTPENRMAGDRRACQQAGDRGPLGELDQREIRTILVAKARRDGGKAHSGDGRNVRKTSGCQRRAGRSHRRGVLQPASVGLGLLCLRLLCLRLLGLGLLHRRAVRC